MSTSFDTSGDGGNAFNYFPGGPLTIGGLAGGVSGAISFPATNDWGLLVSSFPTNPTFERLAYFPIVGSSVDVRTGTVTLAAAVSEPATLALIGLGLSGLALARRRRTR